MGKKLLYFEDVKEWREWLRKNHAREKEAVLLHHRKGKGKSISHAEATEEALCFGWIDSVLRKLDDESFCLRYTPRKKNSLWSKVNKDKAERLIKEGRMEKAGFAEIEKAKKNGLWQKAYTNKKKERMVPELKKELMKNKKAWENFCGFANSYRNMYLGWIKGAKTEETRKRRIAEVVKRSALGKKPGIG